MALNHGSDYFLILLQFKLCLAKAKLQLGRAWKKADFELVAIITAQELLFPGELTTLDRIDIYSDYLVDFTQRLVDLAVSQAKSSGFSVPWQTREVVEAVRADREARYQWLDLGLAKDWLECLRTNRAKYSVIAKAQQRSFREAVIEVAEGEGVQRLAKWSRTKAQLPTELLVMPAL